MRHFALLCFLLCATPYFAQEQRVHFVLDASGSMWGQIEGRSKIEIAREAFAEMLGEWPSGTQLGMTAYGHRRKGDCGDIEALFATGAHDPDALVKRVNSIKPKGKTPLYDAVAFAAESLDFQNKNATVILLSDGKETCTEDPCGKLKALAQKGVKLTVHIIGFDVSQEEAEQLHCMAEATGGTYYSAQDAAELTEALGSLVAVELKPVEEEISDASIQIPAEVEAGTTFLASWTGPNNPHDRLKVVASGAGAKDFSSSYRYVNRGSPLELKAPDTPGPYDVIYVTGQSRTLLARASFKCTPPAVSITSPGTVQAGSQFQVEWIGPGNSGETLRIFALGAPDETRGSLHYTYAVKDRKAILRAPTQAGSYEIRYVSAQTRKQLASVTFEVTPASATLSFPERVHAGEPLNIEWSGPGNSGDRIVWVDAEAKTSKFGHYAYAKSGASPVALVAPVSPGNYEVQYLNHKREVVVSMPLQVIEANVGLEGPDQAKIAEEITIGWFGPQASGDMVAIYGQVDGREKRFAHVYAVPKHSPAKLLTPSTPGDYEMHYFHGHSREAMLVKSLKVVDRDFQWTVPTKVKAGESFNIQFAEPGLKHGRTRILQGKKQVGINYSTGKTEITMRAPKDPGTYLLAYEIGVQIKRHLVEAELVVE
jgi:Ca-activated chloride channel family protein